MRQQPTPQQELDELSEYVRETGETIFVEIDAQDDEATFTIIPEVEAALSDRLIKLTEQMMANEIGSEWKAGQGGIGTFRIDGTKEPWLDYDDREGDYAYERVPDLEYCDWNEEFTISDDGPTP